MIGTAVGLIFLFAILLWIVPLVATPMVASSKGHSALLWFVLALFFGAIALLIIAIIPPQDTRY